MDRQGDKIDDLTNAAVRATKAERVSTSAAETAQSYTNKSIESGRNYVEASSNCAGYTDAEYRVLGDLIKESNAVISNGKMPRNKGSKE